MVLLALFGAVMGQGVVWYTGQFYAQRFLETDCFVEFEQSRTIMLWAIALATPFFILWGWLSDKIGRKWIMMAGMALAIFTYRPIFSTFLNDTRPEKWEEKGIEYFSFYENLPYQKIITNNDSIKVVTTRSGLENGGSAIATLTYKKEGLSEKAISVTFSNKHLPKDIYWKFIGLVFLLILYVTMVYGPIAAFLVELFPTKIRYTSMSLPYHIGNGVFGGLVPFIGLLLTTTFPADPLVGLWYPIGIAALCLVIGVLYLNNKIDRNIKD
jgi:MFS family permease